MREVVGTQDVSPEERMLFEAQINNESGSSIATLYYADRCAEGEYCSGNDRANLSAEFARATAKEEADRAARKERYRTRLHNLT